MVIFFQLVFLSFLYIFQHFILLHYNLMKFNLFVLFESIQDGRVNALYSTPSIYTDAKHSTNRAWPLKTGDYFPYVEECGSSYFLLVIFAFLLRYKQIFYQLCRSCKCLLDRLLHKQTSFETLCQSDEWLLFGKADVTFSGLKVVFSTFMAWIYFQFFDVSPGS